MFVSKYYMYVEYNEISIIPADIESKKRTKRAFDNDKNNLSNIRANLLLILKSILIEI